MKHEPDRTVLSRSMALSEKNQLQPGQRVDLQVGSWPVYVVMSADFEHNLINAGVSYSDGGGHYDWGTTVSDTVDLLIKDFQIKFHCEQHTAPASVVLLMEEFPWESDHEISTALTKQETRAELLRFLLNPTEPKEFGHHLADQIKRYGFFWDDGILLEDLKSIEKDLNATPTGKNAESLVRLLESQREGLMTEELKFRNDLENAVRTKFIDNDWRVRESATLEMANEAKKLGPSAAKILDSISRENLDPEAQMRIDRIFESVPSVSAVLLK